MDAQGSSCHRSILWVPLIFMCATAALYAITLLMFSDKAENQSFKFPRSIEDIQEMTKFLEYLKRDNMPLLIFLFSLGYIYKQTFAIPGSVFLNVLAGAMFGPIIGFIIVCPLSAIGASNCFLLSKIFGRSYVVKRFPEQVQFFQTKVQENKDSLFFFMLFLRIIPMSPNWVINIVAPLVGVPLDIFFLSVLFGLMPYNFICVQTGSVLSEVTSVNDIFTSSILIKLSLAALAALLPGLIIKRVQTSQR